MEIEGEKIVTLASVQAMKKRHSDEIKELQEEVRVLIEDREIIKSMEQEKSPQDNQSKEEAKKKMQPSNEENVLSRGVESFFVTLVDTASEKKLISDDFLHSIFPNMKYSQLQAYLAILIEKEYIRRFSSFNSGHQLSGYRINPKGFIAAEQIKSAKQA